jgi:hypothetical protein
VLRQILEQTGRFEVRVNEEVRGNGSETFAPYDVLLLNYTDRQQTEGPWWDNQAREALLDFVRNGKALVCYHASNNAFWGWEEYDKLVGGTWREKANHTPYHYLYGQNCGYGKSHHQRHAANLRGDGRAL